MLAEREDASCPHRGGIFFRRFLRLGDTGETISEAESRVGVIGLKSGLVVRYWYGESFATADRINGMGTG